MYKYTKSVLRDEIDRLNDLNYNWSEVELSKENKIKELLEVIKMLAKHQTK